MLSVVIPTKNEEGSLPGLLASLKRQTLQPAEVIVADARSTDGTRAVAEAGGARVVEGGLPGVGRNRGAAAASSPLILFLDADVELREDDMLERMVRGLEERGLDVATCEVEPLDASRVDRLLHRAYNRYAKFLEHLFPHAPGFCILVRKTVHDAIGGFDETVTFCEDHDYVQRAAKVARFGILPVKIPVSVRRLERDGRLNIACKYVLAELHLAAVGPIRHDLFKYTFGYGKKGSARRSKSKT